MPDTLERMMFGFIESQTLFVGDKIKLFDYLEEKGPSNCENISRALNLPSSSLERLLIVATCINLLEKRNQNYQLKSEWTPFLSRKSDQYCGEKFSHYWKTSYKIFDHLKTALEENKPQWDKIDKQESSNSALVNVYADFIYLNDTSTREFLETMWASGYRDSVELCEKFTFDNYKNLIDLGGATGSFSIAALHANKDLNAIIMDCVDIKPYAEKKFHEHNMLDRINFHPGDMFKDNLPTGDMYSIGYVLSDWPEQDCLSLIQKIYDSLPSKGLIVILEKFFNEDKTGPYLTAMLNLTMLLEMHGSHRTTSEYMDWLKAVGFTNCQTIYSSGEKHMIIAQKK